MTNSPVGRGWRNLCWPPAREQDGIATIYSVSDDVFGANRSERIGDRRVRDAFAGQDAQWRVQTDRIFRVDGDVTIEPRYSLGYLPGRRLIRQLQGVHPEVVPPLAATLSRRIAGTAERHDALLYFDGFNGVNLWHFFEDAFNPLLLVDSTGLVPADVPILINRRIWQQPLAQTLLRRPPFAERRWLVQDGQTIRTRTLFKGQATIGWFRTAYRLIAGWVDKGGERRIFLNRRPRYGRNLANEAEIAAITRRHGFDTVFAEDLTFDEQIRLFAETRHLVAIHGAGLANMVFCDIGRLRCLELHAENYLNPHYYWMAQVLGIEYYDALLGSRTDGDARFHVDATAFERQLQQLLESDRGDRLR